MSMNDLLSDSLTRIRNGQMATLAYVYCHASNLVEGMLDVLKREGYIRDYEREGEGTKQKIRVDLKYHDGGPVIKKLRRVSKPGLRIYSPIDELKKVHNGLGISILSTSRGLLSDNEARQQKVGGEVLCEVF